MNTEEQNNAHRSYFLKKIYLKTQIFLYANEIRLLLFNKKHTKCTLNLRSLDFPSAYSSREENSD